MTTIAWDGKTLAADRQLNHAWHKAEHTKVGRLIDGRLYAFSGELGVCLAMVAWLNGTGVRPAEPGPSEDSATILTISQTGQVMCHHQRGVAWEVKMPFFAIGSGQDYAMGAMAMGATATEAVLVANRFDISTGCLVDRLAIEPSLHAVSSGA